MFDYVEITYDDVQEGIQTEFKELLIKVTMTTIIIILTVTMTTSIAAGTIKPIKLKIVMIRFYTITRILFILKSCV